MAISCPARMKTAPTQSSDGDRRPNGDAESELEEVADRAEIVLGGDAANRGTDPERQQRASRRPPTRPTTRAASPSR